LETGIPARLTVAEGRSFAFTVGGAFGLFAALLWWRGHPTGAAIAGVLGAALIGAGILAPTRLGPVHRTWMGFAHLLSRITTPVALAIIYFGLFLPIGLGRRLLGKNSLVHGDAESAWVRRPSSDRRSDLERQF
jgi:hypothetical protein